MKPQPKRRANPDVLAPKGAPIPSNCSPERLGAELARANLQSIEDPELRAAAFMDVLSRLIISTARNPSQRDEITSARLEAARRGRPVR